MTVDYFQIINYMYNFTFLISEITVIYFIVSGEISVYLMKIKVVSITSELISYHFTSD